MNPTISLHLSLALVLSFLFGGIPISAQDPTVALTRGYRAGYTDGYMAGYKDISENLSRDARRHPEFASADRTYTAEFGKLEDFQDGYRQGFAKGYTTGFDRKPFDSSVPADLRLGGGTPAPTPQPVNPSPAPSPTPSPTPVPTVVIEEDEEEIEDFGEVEEEDEEELPVSPTPQPTPVPAVIATPTPVATPQPTPTPQVRIETPRTDTPADEFVISRDTVLILEMGTKISTEATLVGDRFKAKIISPIGLTDAIVEGRVANVRKPGRIRRRAELTLVFETITLKDGRSAPLTAILSEVLSVKNDNVRTVDREGTIEGKVFDRGDGIRITAVTGSAAAVGAVVAGPGGAVVGAGIGALANVASTLSRGGKHITIQPLQQLRLRTTREVRIK
jgi:hypothetical protein